MCSLAKSCVHTKSVLFNWTFNLLFECAIMQETSNKDLLILDRNGQYFGTLIYERQFQFFYLQQMKMILTGERDLQFSLFFKALCTGMCVCTLQLQFFCHVSSEIIFNIAVLAGTLSSSQPKRNINLEDSRYVTYR